MAQTTELVMRGGRFLRKTTTVEEQDIGGQVELLQKLLPRPASTVHNLGQINWRGKQAPVHSIHSGNKLALFAEVPSIGPRCIYSPRWNTNGERLANRYPTFTIEQKADFMKKIHDHVDCWDPRFGRTAIGSAFEVITQADIPWNVADYGPLLFIIVFETAKSPSNHMTGMKGFYYTGTYMAALEGKELKALDLVNHFDDGRVCMGNEFDQQFYTGNIVKTSLIESMQKCADSYNTTQSNNHLHHSRMDVNWRLNPKRDNLASPGCYLLKNYSVSLPFMMGLV
jgi:hypothetical protein